MWGEWNPMDCELCQWNRHCDAIKKSAFFVVDGVLRRRSRRRVSEIRVNLHHLPYIFDFQQI